MGGENTIEATQERVSLMFSCWRLFLLLSLINLLSLERAPNLFELSMTCKAHERSFRQYRRALLALKSSNASTLLNSLIVSWMATSFPRLAANPQHAQSNSRSVRLLTAPRSVDPRFSPSSPQPVTHSWLLLEGGSWPLLAVWDPRFSWGRRRPATHFWFFWSVRLLAAPRSVNPQQRPRIPKSSPIRALLCPDFSSTSKHGERSGCHSVAQHILGKCHSSNTTKHHAIQK